MAGDAKQEWLDVVGAAVRDGTLVKVSLGAPRRSGAEVRRLLIRPVALREGSRLQFVWQLATHDVTKNLEVDEGLARIGELAGVDFCIGNLFTTQRTAQLEFRRGRAGRVMYSAPSAAPVPAGHDRTKARRVDVRQPWLHALGVTTAEGAVCKGMEAKFRQIHRFVELLEPLLAEVGLPAAGPGLAAPSGPIRLVDMGCGKGYLTFALHEHLRAHAGRPVRTRGVESRQELVDLDNRVARETGADDLEFVAGTIADVPAEPVDVLVALHACDTATDDALAAGIGAGAALLVVSPCCHREVRPQLQPPPALAGMLRHGILRERQAEMVTDGLRAGLLEWAGYDPRVFEFISPEHTGKNLMIAAVRRAAPVARGVAERGVRELAAAYGIRRHRLAERLGLALTEAA